MELNFSKKFNLAKICLEVFLAFVRSGNIVVSDGNFNVVGYVGGYRSSTVESNLQNYMLWFKPDVVYSAQGWNLHAGFPLRCLYPGSA